jgi:hypothetical protein
VNRFQHSFPDNTKKKPRIMKKLFYNILFLLILSSCCRNPATYKIPDDFKQYILFPKDSWWIYKDQNNNMDTLRIIRVDNPLLGDKCEGFAEKLTIQYSSTRFGVFTGTSEMFVPNLFYYCCSPDKKYFIDLSSTTEQNPFASCNYAAYWHFEPSMVVESITYNDVLVVIADTIGIYHEVYRPSECYFVKNIGLIQVKYFDGSEWKLTEFFINNKP